MIPWVQVYSNLPQHDKVVSFADALGLKCPGVSPEAVATGMLVSLWCWAVQNRTDGDLSGVNHRTIAKACQWEKSPDKLVEALKGCGWLDDDMHIHDWEEYSVRLMENQEAQKEKTRKRVAEYRERHAKGGRQRTCNADENDSAHINNVSSNADVTVTCNADVTASNEPVTQCNASTVPNHTIPYHTVTVDVENNSVTGTAVTRYTDDTGDALLKDFEHVRQAWNALGLGQIGSIDPMTARGASLANRLQKYGLDRVLTAIGAVQASAFLRGDNPKGWRASLDWILQEDHLVRAAEGGYADYKTMSKPEAPQEGPRREDYDRMQRLLAQMEGGQKC